MFSRLAACLVILKIATTVTGAPVETTPSNPVTETTDCNNENSDVYDQRQNGTENYRIHVNGVVVLVAPAETVLQAAQLSNFPMGIETGTNSQSGVVLKPKPRPPLTVTDKAPTESVSNAAAAQVPSKDSKDKNDMKLLNLLHMFRSIRHDTEGHVPSTSTN